MTIETEGRSDVPHFARRLCLLVRQTCGKIAHAVPAHSFLISRLRCLFVMQQILRRSTETHNSIAPISMRQDTLDEKKKKKKAHNDFPRAQQKNVVSTSAHVSMFPRWSARHIIYG